MKVSLQNGGGLYRWENSTNTYFVFYAGSQPVQRANFEKNESLHDESTLMVDGCYRYHSHNGDGLYECLGDKLNGRSSYRHFQNRKFLKMVGFWTRLQDIFDGYFITVDYRSCTSKFQVKKDGKVVKTLTDREVSALFGVDDIQYS